MSKERARWMLEFYSALKGWPWSFPNYDYSESGFDHWRMFHPHGITKEEDSFLDVFISLSTDKALYSAIKRIAEG